MIDNKVVGQAIAKLRQAENMTQQTLAACLNVSHQAVSKWEKGATLPDVLTLVEITRMFGVTMEQLLSGDVDFRISGENEPAANPIELKLDYTDIRAKAEKAVEEAEFAAEEAEAEHEAIEETPEETPEDGEAIDLDKIIEMAPFMSRAALDEIVMKYNGKCSPRQLSRLAPFLSKETLEKLVINCESDIGWDTLRRIAPFLRREFVDAFTAAAAKGEKYTGDLGKQIKHGIKKVYDFGDQIYHEAIKPAIKKVIKPEKPAKYAHPAETPAAQSTDRVAAARVRLFERALSEEKFSWIADHMDQLTDEALKAKIAARAIELGMHDWVQDNMEDYCSQEALDDAILSGNWDFVAANIEFAGEDALALIADTAAAEGKWDWLAGSIEYIAECDDARQAVIAHALKAGNISWLAENADMLELTEADVKAIVDHARGNGSWAWLAENIGILDGGWADTGIALQSYKEGHPDLAMAIIENHLDGEDLTPVIRAAIEAGDIAFAAAIREYNGGDMAALCLELASGGHLKEAVDMAEDLDPDSIAPLLDIAAEQGDWELIDRINDLLG